MWPFKKKTNKQNKQYPYRRYESYNYSAWDNLSIIEKLCMITMPFMLVFIIYMIISNIGLLWYFTLSIATAIVVVLMTLIWWIVVTFIDE